MFEPISGGTKIIVGEGFRCWLPPIPPKEYILFSNLPKEEQYWRRTPLPKYYTERIAEEQQKQKLEFELVLVGQRKKVTYVDPVLERYRRQEWYRRTYGCWIMLNGVPTFLTNDHYYYLQWTKWDHPYNDGYPFYYEFSRDNFYIRKWNEENPLSLGYIFIGPRATGKSNEELAVIMNRATRLHNQRAALQSKHFEDDAKGVLIQAKSVPLFNNLPKFFKPRFSHSTDAKEQLVFKRGGVGGSASADVEFNPDLELNSTIFAAPPGEGALDTETLTDLLEDEVGKTDPKKVADIYVRHGKNQKCIFRNHRKIGIHRHTSTVELMNEGGDECHHLWKDSDPTVVDNAGWTKSKIHRHLISALDTDTSLQAYIDVTGKNWGIPCNKFGQVNRELANKKIQDDLDGVKDDLKEMSSRMRKSPRNPTEAFIKDQSKSIFNIQKCANRLEEIRNRMHKKPYVRGNLYWLKDKFGPVGFAPDEHAGRFNWAYFPDEFTGIKEPGKWTILNNVKREWGYNRQGRSKLLVYPGNAHLFRIGTDPIKFTNTDDPRASKAAAHGFRLFDALVDMHTKKENWKSHNFIFEYINRPHDPEIYFEDMAMACIFLGCKMLPERNVDTLNGYFKYNGLDYMLWYPKDDIEDATATEDGESLSVQRNSDEGGLAQSKEVTNYYTIRIMQFINEHVHRMPFDNTIEDWMNFDSLKPTKHDPTVSSGMTLVHCEKKAELPEEESGDDGMSDWFDRYDNSGVAGRFAGETVATRIR